MYIGFVTLKSISFDLRTSICLHSFLFKISDGWTNQVLKNRFKSFKRRYNQFCFASLFCLSPIMSKKLFNTYFTKWTSFGMWNREDEKWDDWPKLMLLGHGNNLLNDFAIIIKQLCIVLVSPCLERIMDLKSCFNSQ